MQAGYNWQAANWVFGLEADIQASSQRDKQACVQTCVIVGAPILFAAYDARLPWFGTARGRLGYSVGSTLFYATGGFAYGGVNTKIAASFLGVPANFEISSTRTGWTVGGGIETPLSFLPELLGRNWTSKTEYLYVDLGTQTGSTTIAIPGAGVVTATNSTQVREHIFRIRPELPLQFARRRKILIAGNGSSKPRPWPGLFRLRGLRILARCRQPGGLPCYEEPRRSSRPLRV